MHIKIKKERLMNTATVRYMTVQCDYMQMLLQVYLKLLSSYGSHAKLPSNIFPTRFWKNVITYEYEC